MHLEAGGSCRATIEAQGQKVTKLSNRDENTFQLLRRLYWTIVREEPQASSG